MKTSTVTYSFADILRKLALQKPEEKLRIAFDLRDFVIKLQKVGEKYAKTSKRSRAGRTA